MLPRLVFVQWCLVFLYLYFSCLSHVVCVFCSLSSYRVSCYLTLWVFCVSIFSVSEDVVQAETRQDRSQSTTFQVLVFPFLSSSCLVSRLVFYCCLLPCPVLSSCLFHFISGFGMLAFRFPLLIDSLLSAFCSIELHVHGPEHF